MFVKLVGGPKSLSETIPRGYFYVYRKSVNRKVENSSL